MKIFTGVLVVLLVISLPASSQVFGKKKSQEEALTEMNNTKIDSLTRANQALTLIADSVSAELAKYYGVYTVIVEKVIRYNFDPAKTSFLIDSLKTSRDSAFAKLSPLEQSGAASDSINMLKDEIRILRAAMDSTTKVGEEKLTALTTQEIEQAKAIDNLKKLKDLLDSKILTDSEFIAAKKKYVEKL